MIISLFIDFVPLYFSNKKGAIIMIDQKEFFEKYKQHLAWLSIDAPDPSHTAKVFEIFSAVIKNGGWVRTIGLNNWDSISQIPNSRDFYESSHLVSFERKLRSNWPHSPEITKKINFKLLQPVSITESLQFSQMEEILSEDLFLYRNVFKLGLNPDLISLQAIRSKHGEEEISVIVQESNTSGFSVKKASKQKMKLKHYVDLMQGTIRDDKFIRFAVNIDIGNWRDEIDEIRKKLPSQVLWCSKEDSLKYLRQHVLGMTLPQLYLKINGCWTGGHEENLRFASANINHGPSGCEWWGLDQTQSLQLRECIRNDKNFEIYNSETLWWPDEIYCIINGFRIFHVIQQPGDLVVVGPGTIHWVKSCGVTTNTAWNFGPKTRENFVRSFERDYINQAIKYKSLVPMNILSLDLLNNELETLNIDLVEYLKEAIILKNASEVDLYRMSGLSNIEVNNTDNAIHCEECYMETFRIYYKCVRCTNNRYRGGVKHCFFCYSCMKNHGAKCKGTIVPVQKFKKSDFNELIKNIDLRCEGKSCKYNFEALKYPFDKNIEEGIYVSPYDGFTDQANEEMQNLSNFISSDELNKESLGPNKSIDNLTQKASDSSINVVRTKRKYVKRNKEEKKLSSLVAKKKMSEFPGSDNISKFLKSYSAKSKSKPKPKTNLTKSSIPPTSKTTTPSKSDPQDLPQSSEIQTEPNPSNPEPVQDPESSNPKDSSKTENHVKPAVKTRSRRRLSKEQKLKNYLKIEENLMNCLEKCEDFKSGQIKRFRSTDIYTPVIGLIPVKIAKVSLA